MKKKQKNKVGYIHISHIDIDEKLQRQALIAEGCSTIFCDKAMNLDFERPELVKAVKRAEKLKESSIYVYSLEQLAGSVENLSDICKVLRRLGVNLISIKEDIILTPYSNYKNNIQKNICNVAYIHEYPNDKTKKLQKQVLESEGCSKVYSGYSEEIDFDRPELVKAVKYMEKNKPSSLVVYSLDKIAFTLENLCDIIKVLKNLGITLRSIDEDIFIRSGSDVSLLSTYNEEASVIELKDDNDFAGDDVKIKRISFDRRFLIKLVVIFILCLVVLSSVYYWLVTRYSDDEMDESEYISIHHDIDI